MPYVPLGLSAYDDNSYGLPSVVLENLFAESAPDSPGKAYRLLPTPGLNPFVTTLEAPVRGAFQVDGLFSGDALVCAKNTVQRVSEAGSVTAMTGSVLGLDRARFASTQAHVVMTAGGQPYLLGASAAEPFEWVGPTGDIVDVAAIAQRHIYLEDGSGRFWWSDPSVPTEVKATSFATAESEPDNLLAIKVWSDTLLLFGSASVEGWVYTGDIEFPFVRRPGFVVQKGIAGRDAVVEADFGVFVLGSDGVLYRVGQAGPERVSTHEIERIIDSAAELSKISLSAHYFNGHPFIGVHMPGVGDYFFDIATGAFHRRKEASSQRYIADQFFDAWNKPYAIDRQAGAIYRVDQNSAEHNGNAVRRVATGLLELQDGRPVAGDVVVDIQSGAGTVEVDDPQVMFQFAPDGRSYGRELQRSFGRQGEFSKQPVFHVGELKPPVAAFRIAVTDAVLPVVSGLKVGVTRP